MKEQHFGFEDEIPLSIARTPRPNHVGKSRHEESFILDIHKNSAALVTLRLLGQIDNAVAPVTEAELIEKRTGGIYPTRTVEEMEQLSEAGLIERVSDKPRRFTVSPFGKMELSLNNVIGEETVKMHLQRALDSITADPPKLPAEKYGNEEWRFTWESIHRLAETIYSDNAYREIDVALLGTPLVGIFLSRAPEIVNTVSVFDVNSDMVDLINEEHNGKGKILASNYDARDAFPPTLAGRFDAFVMDPPWHNEFHCLFADRGWEALRPLGRAYMSTFATGTRPEAGQELRELYGRFMKGGYDVISIIPEFFGYAIPQFEKKVFEAEGIDVSSRGNYGQLVVLEKRPQRNSVCLTDELATKLYRDKNYDLNGPTGKTLTLWVEPTTKDEIVRTAVDISPVKEKTVYTTISRSQRRGDKVNLLTDEHIAYHVTNPYKFALIYSHWRDGASESDCLEAVKEHGTYQDASETDIISDVQMSYGFLNATLTPPLSSAQPFPNQE